MQDKTVPVRAGFGVRAAAYIIDRLILGVALCVVRIPAWLASLSGVGSESVLFNHSGLDILCYILSAVYLVLLTYLTGSTLGKKIMRLHVEKADGSRLRFIDALYRETVGRFLSGILCIGYFMVLVDRDKRAFHDWLCDTQVVYDEKLFAPAPEPEPWTNPCGWTVPGMEQSKSMEAATEDPSPQPLPECRADYTIPGMTAQSTESAELPEHQEEE